MRRAILKTKCKITAKISFHQSTECYPQLALDDFYHHQGCRNEQNTTQSRGLTSKHQKCLSYNSIEQNHYHTNPCIKCMEKMVVSQFSYIFEKR